MIREDEAGSLVAYEKFDVRKLERLNDIGRFETLVPTAMWKALGDPTPNVIVEIGAGTGLFASKFAELAPGSTVYAADTEQVMIEWMTANRPEVGEGRLVPVLASETRVPLSDGIADLVVMINLHHELARPDATYREARRLLVDDGRVLVVDWAPVDTPKGPPLRVRISARQGAGYLSAAGFEDVVAHDTLPWHWMVTATRR